MQKSHPKVVNPRDIAGERKKKTKQNKNILVSVVNISNSKPLPIETEQKMAEIWFENPNFNSFS